VTTQDSSDGRRSGWRLALAGGMLLASLVMAACSTTAAAPAPPHTPVPPTALATIPRARPIPSPGTANGPQVEIANFNFAPAELTVPVGGAVTWTNNDDAPHTVTSADKTFSSPSISTDGQFTFTFMAPGTYAYFCAIHPFMTGKVIVQ
jgi:amicyanin